jgi:hypothetical protein
MAMVMSRVIAVVVLSTFTLGLAPVSAQAPAPKVRPKTYEILLDVAATGRALKLIQTQQDLGAIETIDDDTRNLMAFALATGTRAIITTHHPVISARFNHWYGTPWLALGTTDPQFGTDQQGFHLNTSHENPNQSDLDLSDDIVNFGMALQFLGNTIATKPIGDAKAAAAARALGAAIAGLGLAITGFGLGMKLAIYGRTGSADPDPDDDGGGGPTGSMPAPPAADPAPPGLGQSIGLTGPDGTSVGGGGGGTPGEGNPGEGSPGGPGSGTGDSGAGGD